MAHLRLPPLPLPGGTEPPDPPDPPLTIALLRERYAPFMKRFLLHLGIRDADVEDVMQEALLVAGKLLPRFEPYEELSLDAALRMWLREICVRKGLEHLRRVAPHERALPLSEDDDAGSSTPGADVLLVEREERREVLSLIGELPPRLRAVVLLCLAGQSVAAIAEELGLPQGTVRTRLRAARSALEGAMARRRRRERSVVLPWWLASMERALAEEPGTAGGLCPVGGYGTHRSRPRASWSLAASLMAFAVVLACSDVALPVQSAPGPAPGGIAAVHGIQPIDRAWTALLPAPSRRDSAAREEAEAPDLATSSAHPAGPRPAGQTLRLAFGARPSVPASRRHERREERAFLAKAQEALAAGRHEAAAAALDMHRRRFPDGTLSDVRRRLEGKVGAARLSPHAGARSRPVE